MSSSVPKVRMVGAGVIGVTGAIGVVGVVADFSFGCLGEFGLGSIHLSFPCSSSPSPSPSTLLPRFPFSSFSPRLLLLPLLPLLPLLLLFRDDPPSPTISPPSVAAPGLNRLLGRSCTNDHDLPDGHKGLCMASPLIFRVMNWKMGRRWCFLASLALGSGGPGTAGEIGRCTLPFSRTFA